MIADDEQAAMRRELSSLEETIQAIRAELRDVGGDLRGPDERALAGRMAFEDEALLAVLERRRDELRRSLGEDTSDNSSRPILHLVEPDHDELRTYDDGRSRGPRGGHRSGGLA